MILTACLFCTSLVVKLNEPEEHRTFEVVLCRIQPLTIELLNCPALAVRHVPMTFPYDVCS